MFGLSKNQTYWAAGIATVVALFTGGVVYTRSSKSTDTKKKKKKSKTVVHKH